MSTSQLQLFARLTSGRIFSRMHTATHQVHRIAIRYVDAGWIETHRTIRPTSLYKLGGEWYVDAFCELRNADRCFRLSRIDAAELLGRAKVSA